MNEVFLASAGKKGLGVFADKHFIAGETIELSPAIPLLVNNSEVERYVYEVECVDQDGKDYSEWLIGCGLSSFYNHSFEPNADFELVDIKYPGIGKRKPGVEIIAIRPILPGEEIVFNYNGDPDDKTPWVF